LVDLSTVAASDFLVALRERDTTAHLRVAGANYELLGRLAQGESTDVFLARRARRVTEWVVIKVLRSMRDEDLVEREWKALSALRRSDVEPGAKFLRRLPEPVGKGTFLDPDGNKRMASVFRWKSGFLPTLADVQTAYPAGVEPRAVVWIWRRILDMLGWVHRSGWVHGAVLFPHVLLHPRDHGALLVGWSCASPVAGHEPLVARNPTYQWCYPQNLWNGGGASQATDLAMTARCMAALLGQGAVPGPLADLVQACVDPPGVSDDAWELASRVLDVAQVVFGPPKYHRFSVPGWGP
jgi:hypothetical protein